MIRQTARIVTCLWELTCSIVWPSNPNVPRDWSRGMGNMWPSHQLWSRPVPKEGIVPLVPYHTIYCGMASFASRLCMGHEGLMPLEFDRIICCAMMPLDHEAAHRPCAQTRCLLTTCWSSYISTNNHYVYKDCWIDGMAPDCPSVNCTELVGSHLPLYFSCPPCHHYSPLSYCLVCLLLCHYIVVLSPHLLPCSLPPTSSPWEPTPSSLKGTISRFLTPNTTRKESIKDLVSHQTWTRTNLQKVLLEDCITQRINLCNRIKKCWRTSTLKKPNPEPIL